MTREQWALLPARIGLLCVVVGVVALAITWYGSGEQVAANTQLPYVLVGGCLGTGLVGLGAALYAAHRVRVARWRVEESAARMLVAATELAERRRTRSEPPAVSPGFRD